MFFYIYFFYYFVWYSDTSISQTFILLCPYLALTPSFCVMDDRSQPAKAQSLMWRLDQRQVNNSSTPARDLVNNIQVCEFTLSPYGFRWSWMVETRHLTVEGNIEMCREPAIFRRTMDRFIANLSVLQKGPWTASCPILWTGSPGLHAFASSQLDGTWSRSVTRTLDTRVLVKTSNPFPWTLKTGFLSAHSV